MLVAAKREYDRQQRLTALAVNQVARLTSRGTVPVARTIQAYQAAAIALSMESLGDILSEQDIDPAADAALAPTSMLTDTRDMTTRLNQTANDQAVIALVRTLVVDASRTARAVDQATRPAVIGYVRSLSPPSCARCAILAGRVYRYSQGFARHPRCDCLMTPTNLTNGPALVIDPTEAFNKGQVTGLTAADTEAVKAGADLGQVVNVRRKEAGLSVGSSVTVRSGRLTPQGCLTLATDRTQAIALLTQFGYITT